MSFAKSYLRLPHVSLSLAALLLALGIPLAVHAIGVLLAGTQPSDGDGDPAFPRFLDGNNDGTFDAPGVCDNCHAGYREAGQLIHEPWDSWAGSMMANAGRDPLFWAALDIANQDDDDILGDIGVGDLCLRCHAPNAWYTGRSDCTTAWGELFDGSCLQGGMDVPDSDFEGIICHYCHRMRDASIPEADEFLDPLAPRGANGQVYLSGQRNLMRGPYSDADPRSHQFVQSAFHRSSAICGECHDVTNPARNRRDPVTGADLGRPMPVERTYSEWKQSAFANPVSPEHRTCQSCHMPVADLDGDGVGDPAYACRQQPGLRGESTALQGPLRTHFFAGASTWMIGVLRGEHGGALGRTLQYDAALTATQRLLASTATLAMTAPPSAPAGTPVPVVARVTNLTGHKFPTGYPEGRRAFVHLVAGLDADADGALDAPEVTFESGAWDPATGELVHDAQARVYEIKLGVWNRNGTGRCDLVDDATGKEMFHFVLNDCVVQDSRIPPLGFVPDVDTAPVGWTYPPDPARPGALANWDDVAYLVPVAPGTTGTLLIETSLYYQSTSSDYIDFLERENRSTCDPFDAGCNPTVADARTNRGEKMRALWESYGRAAPVLLAEAQTSVTVVDAPPEGACCEGSACSERTEADCATAGGSWLGAGTNCAGDPCAPPPPGEASNVLDGAAPLLVTAWSPGTGTLTLSYDPACDATSHAVYWGDLASVRSMTFGGATCGLGVTGSASFVPGAGSFFFVVVGQSTLAEGSYGRDSFGRERAEAVGVGACDLPRDLSATCR